METTNTDKAVFLGNACNPLPFLNRMKEIVKEGTDNNKSAQYRANLLTLIMQSYPTSFTIDIMDEIDKLKKEL